MLSIVYCLLTGMFLLSGIAEAFRGGYPLSLPFSNSSQSTFSLTGFSAEPASFNLSSSYINTTFTPLGPGLSSTDVMTTSGLTVSSGISDYSSIFPTSSSTLIPATPGQPTESAGPTISVLPPLTVRTTTGIAANTHAVFDLFDDGPNSNSSSSDAALTAFWTRASTKNKFDHLGYTGQTQPDGEPLDCPLGEWIWPPSYPRANIMEENFAATFNKPGGPAGFFIPTIRPPNAELPDDGSCPALRYWQYRKKEALIKSPPPGENPYEKPFGNPPPGSKTNKVTSDHVCK